MSPGKFQPTNNNILVMLGGVGVLALIALVMSISGGAADDRPLEGFSLRAEAIPMWADDIVKVPRTNRPEESEVLEVHLDISYPMGGFLPFASSGDDFSALRTVAQFVPDHLSRAYGRTDVSIKWRGIGHELVDLPESPRIVRRLFNGTSTRLDLSIKEILSDLQSGRAEAAALVTDLMATGEMTGPLAVAKELSDWLRSDDVRSGLFHVGLLGVKAEYWGVTQEEVCPEKSGLGCWFSERNPGFRRLDSVVRAPFYVLVMGKGADAVDNVGRSIQDDAQRLGLETRWDLLTSDSRSFDTTMSCTAHKRSDSGEIQDQFALFREESGQYRCVRQETVILSCDLGSGLRPKSVRATDTESTPISALDAKIVGAGIEIAVDCERLRTQPPSSDLGLEVVGTIEAAKTNSWADWSSESDELAEHLGRTLQLRYFVEEVRLHPNAYQIMLKEPLLRASGS